VRAYRRAIVVLAVAFVALGFALIVVGAARGDWLRLLLGGLFVALGTARIHLLRKGGR
jgi:NO-binding membrane sensor protein with MHYT domain